jgi:hypothetical protein
LPRHRRCGFAGLHEQSAPGRLSPNVPRKAGAKACRSSRTRVESCSISNEQSGKEARMSVTTEDSAGAPAISNLVHFNEVDRGGHFAAWEQPELYASELRAGFRSLR